jgi:hypothetical protein
LLGLLLALPFIEEIEPDYLFYPAIANSKHSTMLEEHIPVFLSWLFS